MSVEDALLARARPYMLAEKAQSILRAEVVKGCSPQLLSQPVALEPPYLPVLGGNVPADDQGRQLWVYEDPPKEDDLVRLRLWINPEQDCAWVRSELLLKQLAGLQHRAALEFSGNADAIGAHFLCHRSDLPVLEASFAGQFERCMLRLDAGPLPGVAAPVFGEDLVFNDFLPPPPYSHLFTRPDELKRSPLAALIEVLSRIPPPTLGLYQAVFQPVRPQHNWHQNVQALLDLEYSVKLLGGMTHVQQLGQQAPSGDLRQMAMDLEIKSHTDKPLYCAALRIGVLHGGPAGPDILRALSAMVGMIQHGGRPLDRLRACLRSL